MHLFTHLSYKLQPLYGFKGLEKVAVKIVFLILVNSSNEVLIVEMINPSNLRG